MSNNLSSSGHKLGQIIGDWFEQFFVLELLSSVSHQLNLFLDSRWIERPIRGEKITWEDEEGNSVDYDFVLEIGGNKNQIGIPVAFIECFWRKGSRHSKDKARDDTGKLIPMRNTYPTARFLGIIAAGDFTHPARELIRSRDIDLFYITKQQIVQAFYDNGFIVDYPDKASEAEKAKIVLALEEDITLNKKQKIANTLMDLVGKITIKSYVDRVKAKLSALPQEIRLVLRYESKPLRFPSIATLTNFLENPDFQMNNPQESYLYQITYSDGTQFEQMVNSIEMLQRLHQNIQALANHMADF